MGQTRDTRKAGARRHAIECGKGGFGWGRKERKSKSNRYARRYRKLLVKLESE